jgi:hypothetical protein
MRKIIGMQVRRNYWQKITKEPIFVFVSQKKNRGCYRYQTTTALKKCYGFQTEGSATGLK